MSEARILTIVFATRLNGETGMNQLSPLHALVHHAQAIWQSN